jgi:hypothetical protein
MHTQSERGIALVLALFLMTALSVLGASLMFLSQTEVYASMNYRMMSQARYGGEAGVQKAANFLLDTAQYTVPGGVGDPLTNYDRTKSPVVCLVGCASLNQPVILSATTSQASNYPVAAVQTAFNTAAKGTLTAGNTPISYGSYATLMSMQSFTSYGGSGAVVQTWQITGSGALAGARSASVEVVAVIETMKVPAHMYAAFATAATCGALTFTTGTLTNSYDSSTYVSGTPTLSASAANVGTNGNLNQSGAATVNGTLSTPRVGVGACSSGNVSALSSSGGATVSGGVVSLSQAVALPTPPTPNPVPPTTANTITSSSATCASAALPNCTGPAGNLVVTPVAGTTVLLGNVDLGNSAQLHLKAGTYNINSFKNSGGKLIVDSGPVIINITGASKPVPFDWQGGDILNATFKPENLQIQYGGTGSVLLHAGAETGATRDAMVIYAPNAPISFSQGGDFYGSLVGSTISDVGAGGVQIHYDRHLNSSFFVAGNPMLATFSWKRY